MGIFVSSSRLLAVLQLRHEYLHLMGRDRIGSRSREDTRMNIRWDGTSSGMNEDGGDSGVGLLFGMVLVFGRWKNWALGRTRASSERCVVLWVSLCPALLRMEGVPIRRNRYPVLVTACRVPVLFVDRDLGDLTLATFPERRLFFSPIYILYPFSYTMHIQLARR